MRPPSGRLRSLAADRCRRKFLRFFPGGFHDATYLEWERDYKWEAHERWVKSLRAIELARAIENGEYEAVAQRAIAIEARTNLLFSFEKMALRDAVRTYEGARILATGLYELLHGPGEERAKFQRWCDLVSLLPRKQTRVLTWPLVTVFGFIAQPKKHIFLKPVVTRKAAAAYGFDFEYKSRPTWTTYASLLAFAAQVRRDNLDLRPRDMIDLQGFIWVQGSDEYE